MGRNHPKASLDRIKNLEKYNNNNLINNTPLPLYQPFLNKDIIETVNFVSKNQLLSPLKTFNILNTLNSFNNLYLLLIL